MASICINRFSFTLLYGIVLHHLNHQHILLMVAILSEIGQYFEIVPGTFDIFDLPFYILEIILPI